MFKKFVFGSPVQIGSNFDNLVKKNNKIVLAFMADWCGTCNKIDRDFSQRGVEKLLEGIDIKRIDTDEFSSDDFSNLVPMPRAIPSFIAYRDGMIVGNLEGYTSPGQFIEKVQLWYK